MFHLIDTAGMPFMLTVAEGPLKEETMLYWAAACFIIAIVAALLGFVGLATAAAGIAKILFYIFLIFFVITLVMGLSRRGTRV